MLLNITLYVVNFERRCLILCSSRKVESKITLRFLTDWKRVMIDPEEVMWTEADAEVNAQRLSG